MNPEITKISLIASLDEDRGIGRNGQLLFRVPGDLPRFRELTTNHPIIMGRTTFESIGKPLPRRINIVTSRDPNYQPPGLRIEEHYPPTIVIAHSLDEAFDRALELEQEEIFVIGGAQIYEQTIDRADRLYLTLVKGTYGADVFFPDYSDFRRETFREDRESSGYRYSWVNLER